MAIVCIELADRARQPKVCQFDHAITVEQQVGGLDVAMQQLAAVHVPGQVQGPKGAHVRCMVKARVDGGYPMTAALRQIGCKGLPAHAPLARVTLAP